MELPLSALSASGLNSGAYQSLRQEVYRLKEEHTQLQGARRTAKQLERLAVLQQKNELQLQEEQYQLKIAQLQASLQEAHDRCGKIRLQYERSLRIVQAKANKLAKRLEEEHGSLESCTEALSHQHAEQVHVLEHQIAEAQHMQAAEKDKWEAEQQQLQLKAAEWCEQQIQLERQKAAHAMAAAEATANDWKQKCEDHIQSLLEEQQLHDVTRNQLDQAQLDNKALRANVDSLQQDADQAKQANTDIQAQLTAKQQAWVEQETKLKVDHDAQVAEQSKRKLQEMNAVHDRFKQIVQKKDASHYALLEQLREMQLQCSGYEAVLQQQQLQMRQLVGS